LAQLALFVHLHNSSHGRKTVLDVVAKKRESSLELSLLLYSLKKL